MNIKLILSIILASFLLFITTSYADSADSAFRYADRKDWDKALKASNSYPDPVLRKIILSKRFFDTSYKENSFEEISSFIQNNPNWPRINALKEIAENYITSSTRTDYIVKWFSKHHPKTPNGHKFYAINAAKIITDKAQLQKILKECWIYGNFSPEESRSFLAKNKGVITSADHVKKIDQLLWSSQREEARRMLGYVGTEGKAAYNAHLALLDDKPNKDMLFRKLPKEHKHNSGILFKYLEQYKKADTIPVAVAELLLHAPEDKAHHKDWWRIKNLYAKNMLQQHKYNLAYNIAHKHIGSCNKDKSDSEWLSGWIALRFLHKPELAYKHFQNMHNSVKYPISLARGAYWLGEAAKAMKNKELAHKWFREAAAFNFTFYGQIAMLELGNTSIISLPPKPKITATDRAFYKKNELSRATNLFIKHKKYDSALEYAKAAIGAANNIGEAALIVSSLKSCNNRHYTVEITKAAAQKGYLLIPDNPTPYKIPKTSIEPALTYSIITKESAFNQYAISHANCHGLMQVLPATGCKISKKLKHKCSTKRLTSDPIYNITLGNKYLEELLAKYNGSYLLTAAAYNAGPEPVDKWIIKNGDPRKLKTVNQVVHWIESMPYYETRDYVQRILENVQVYREIINKQSEFRLKKDLFRGSQRK